jgi:hypothetical protein
MFESNETLTDNMKFGGPPIQSTRFQKNPNQIMENVRPYPDVAFACFFSGILLPSRSRTVPITAS